MKCNHCKKIIPEREEIREDNKCFHEECAEIMKKRQKELNKTGAILFIATIVIIALSAAIFKWWINSE